MNRGPHLKIEKISAEQTHPLRQSILRPHQPLNEMAYPFDQEEGSCHFGAFIEKQLVGIASIYPESKDGEIHQGYWRLRGMAVDSSLQGKGVGRQLVEACLNYAQGKNAKSVWCNARTSAVGFYLSLGFRQVGEEFEIKGIGPHYFAEIHF